MIRTLWRQEKSRSVPLARQSDMLVDFRKERINVPFVSGLSQTRRLDEPR